MSLRHWSVAALFTVLTACAGGEAPAEAPAEAEPAAEAEAPQVDEALEEVVEEKAAAAMAENIQVLLQDPVEVSDAQKASCDKLSECSCGGPQINACHQAAAKLDLKLVESGKDAHGTWTGVASLECAEACEGFLKSMESEFRDLTLE